MIKCPKCGADILDTADNCIYCGITRATIDEMLIRNRLIKAKKNNKRSNKKLIAMTEVMFLLIAATFYINLYIPKILNIIEENKLKNIIKSCEEDYLGEWDYETSKCITLGESIIIK